jgi:hypothetical protein
MIRTFALAIALISALGAVAYAQNMRGFAQNAFKNPRTLGGQVNADGSVAQGSHFTVVHIGTGKYEVDFDERYFATGCPILTVTPVNALAISGRVSVVRCRAYYAYFSENDNRFDDTAFDLVAVAAN